MKPDSSARGMALVVSLCALAGLITVAATLAFARISSPAERTASSAAAIGATEEYGKRLISQTSEYLGPDVADPKMSVPLKARETIQTIEPPRPICTGRSCEFWIQDCELGVVPSNVVHPGLLEGWGC